MTSHLGCATTRVASLDGISFEEDRGTLFMQGANGTKIGDATSTKQNLDGDLEAMILASKIAGDYYYNVLDPQGKQKMLPDGTRITNAGWQ